MHAREEDRGKGEGGIFTSEGWNRRERTKGLRKKLAGQAEGLGNVNGIMGVRKGHTWSTSLESSRIQ